MGNDSVDNLFAVTLVDAGDRRIEVIKAIRSTTGLGLKDSKELVDKAREEPTTVVGCVPGGEAGKILSALWEAAAKARLSQNISAMATDCSCQSVEEDVDTRTDDDRHRHSPQSNWTTWILSRATVWAI